MRRRAIPVLAAALLACVTSAGPEPDAPALWTAPEPPQDPASLRIEPGPAVVATLGSDVKLRLRGSGSGDAHCLWGEDGHGSGRLRIASPGRAGVIEVRCRSGVHTASAQVTFSESATRPFEDPYAGAVLLVKLRKAPRGAHDPRGRRELGLRSIDTLLERLGAHALPAFPFDRSGARDPIGLERWIALYVPPGVNVYQTVALLRDDPQVFRESVHPIATPDAISRSTPLGVAGKRDTGMARVPLHARRGHIPGFGIGIAVVGQGIDGDDEALSHRVRSKPWETAGNDADGNGLPGDRMGADFARLVVDTAEPVPQLVLAASGGSADYGDAATARIALDAAPGAWLLPVRVGGSTWSRALGLVYALPADLKAVYDGFGIDLPKYNGDSSWTLPIPARFVADPGGVIRYAEADADYSVRPEPEETLAALRAVAG